MAGSPETSCLRGSCSVELMIGSMRMLQALSSMDCRYLPCASIRTWICFCTCPEKVQVSDLNEGIWEKYEIDNRKTKLSMQSVIGYERIEKLSYVSRGRPSHQNPGGRVVCGFSYWNSSLNVRVLVWGGGKVPLPEVRRQSPRPRNIVQKLNYVSRGGPSHLNPGLELCRVELSGKFIEGAASEVPLPGCGCGALDPEKKWYIITTWIWQ